MAEDKRKILEEVFDLFDTDKSGKVDQKELKAAVTEYYKAQKLPQPTPEEQIDADTAAILSACDTSHDGKIDKAEWFNYFKV